MPESQDIRFIGFGGTTEVGRSCYLIFDDEDKVLVDCGIKLMSDEPTQVPEGVLDHARDLKTVLLTHAHMDHSGFIPALYHHGYEGKVHLTQPTADLIRILWPDSLKIEGPVNWDHQDMQTAFNNCEAHAYQEEIRISEGITARFFNAGHIIGSASCLLRWRGVNIFHTGDFSSTGSLIHDPAAIPEDIDIDILITETTYAGKQISSLRSIRRKLRSLVLEVGEKKSKLMIPAFATGRSQLIEFLLARLDIKTPIYLDGMIRQTNRIYSRYFNEPWISKDLIAWASANMIRDDPFSPDIFTPIDPRKLGLSEKPRKEIMASSEPAIIVTTSGMLSGGAILSYLRFGGGDNKNILVFTGYQAEGTLGREILNGRRDLLLRDLKGEEHPLQLEARIEFLELSGHTDHSSLCTYIRNINPSRIILIHGEPDNQTKLIKSLNKDFPDIIQVERNKEISISKTTAEYITLKGHIALEWRSLRQKLSLSDLELANLLLQRFESKQVIYSQAFQNIDTIQSQLKNLKDILSSKSNVE
ncbi:MAG: MBL fold metallo-hydrolase [Promethearchaeota archaeon]